MKPDNLLVKESDCRLWAIKDPLLTEYHDHEWCKISHDDRHIFEMLCLEGQAYKKAFFDFDIAKCASLTDEYLYSLLENAALIRNKNKIFSIRKNAIVVMKVIEQYGSFDKFVWSYTDGKQIVGHWEKSSEIPAETEISGMMSKDFRKLGMAFVGPVITYSFMQSIGMVNDHLMDCRYR